MRVLHVDTGAEMRGGQWQSLQLVEALGADATLLAAADGPLERRARERSLDVLPFNLARLALLGRSYDLVHVHDARAHTWAASLGGAPLVVSRRVAFAVRESVLSRWKYARPAHFIAVSECVREVLLTAGVPRDRVSVVYDGVALPKHTAVPEKIVAVDTTDEMKGSALIREAAQRGGFEVVFSSDLQRDLPSASVFIYISYAEGLGSAALLAMAYGVPVVASRIGGLPEVVQDGVTGILTDNEPVAICRAVRTALERREELAASARAAAAQRFSLEAMVEGTREVYRKVLG